ncbi:MAG: dTDP-glucose 4,6-dehydratase [Candidatus Omnitrophica bacterium]|nr:dTDP-glucose 4,6-dehydratase [Candidatus Omnitrophota bacterium]
MSKTILITGGAGFIGSELVRQISCLKDRVIVIDKLTYSGDLARLKSVKNKITFYKLDITDNKRLRALFDKVRPDYVIHCAAETHVDRSITDNTPFIKTNIMGTQNLIDASREFKVKKFLHVSTDEVYGEHACGYFKETDQVQPRNPYAVTKAAGDLLVQAAVKTYGFPAMIVRPCNCYGSWQYPEKLIPVVISKILSGQKAPVYGQGKQIREWLYVEDCARGIQKIFQKGIIGGIYNIGSGFEQPNIKTVLAILKLLGKNKDSVAFVKDRPGHDFRYSVDFNCLKFLGWKPLISFEDGLRRTVAWYIQNQKWVKQKNKIRR